MSKPEFFVRAAKGFRDKYLAAYPEATYGPIPDAIAAINDGDVVAVSGSIYKVNGKLVASVFVEDNFDIPDECVHDVGRSVMFLRNLYE